MTPLRVVVLGEYHADSFAENIADCCRALGWQTALISSMGLLSWGEAVTVRSTLASAAIRFANESSRRVEGVRRLNDLPIAKALERAEPDLVLSTDGYLSPRQVERLRRITPKAKWALWYPDALSNLGAQFPLAAPWDRIFFKDPYLVEVLTTRTSMSNIHFMPEACNPRRHRPEPFTNQREVAQYTCDVVVVGNIYPYRIRVLETLPTDLDLKLYGRLARSVTNHPLAARFTGQYLTGRAKALAFRGAKVVLNTLHYAEINSVNARLFEATACGAFVATQRTPGLGALFTPGAEVASFDNAAEMRDAISYYLTKAEERASIASRGQARSHREHTYENRLREISKICGVDPQL